MELKELKNVIKNLDEQNFKKIVSFIMKENEKRNDSSIIKASKKLFQLYPDYDIIVIGEKYRIYEGDAGENVMSDTDNYKFVPEFRDKKIMNDVIDFSDPKVKPLIKQIEDNLDLDIYPDCEYEDRAYLIYVTKDLQIKDTDEF